MKMNLRRALFPAALTAALLVGSVSAFAQETQDVTMAFCTWTGYAPMFIAQEMGYFEEAGINMNIEIIEDESTYAALLVQGSVQFLATAQDPNIKMYANGAPSRFVLTMDASCGADGLVTTADVKTLDDLAGKTLALDTAASSYYFFLTALENGSSLTEADITLAEMSDTTEAGLAFELRLHYRFWRRHILRSRTAVSDMGGLDRSAPDYDNNAILFERAARRGSTQP
jgi:NitT/TauT family transport system substrate-binding protein